MHLFWDHVAIYLTKVLLYAAFNLQNVQYSRFTSLQNKQFICATSVMHNGTVLSKFYRWMFVYNILLISIKKSLKKVQFELKIDNIFLL